jgi:methionyl-tRNA formyltransferase
LSRLILLTQREFAPAVAAPLQAASADVRLAESLSELETLLTGGSARLVSFGSGVIVPAQLLAQTAGAYNFHPGPPSYPGIFPSVFALYDGARSFGVTLHEMTAQVDAGPIVAAETFTIAPHYDRLALDTATFGALMGILKKNAALLADTSKPLPRINAAWGARTYTRKDFDALCRLPDDVSDEEFARRYRAVGEGPEHALTITRFGRAFRLESRNGGPVVRGGQQTT